MNLSSTHHPRHSALALAISLALLGAAAGTHAQTPAALPPGAAVRHFDLPAGPLAQALDRFGRSAGVNLSYDPALVNGVTTQGVSGEVSVESALRALLRDTGLEAVAQPGGGYSLRKAAAGAAAPAAAGALPHITVSGQAETESATGPLRGYLARRSASATKTDTPVLEIPQSISVVTRDEMDARAANSVLEVLRYMPGANTETHGVDPRGYDYFNLRGFINAQNTSDFLNGLRQVGGGFGMFRTEPYGLERVEVLRGAGSVMFGQGDPGGTINRVSKVAGTGAGNELMVDVGSFNRRQVTADLNGKFDEDGKLQGRFVGLLLDSDNQFDYGNGRAGNNDRVYLAPSLNWRPSAATSFTLLASYTNDSSGSGRWTAVRPDGTKTHLLYGNPDFDKQHNEQWSLGYMLEHRLDDTWTLRQNFRQAGLNSTYNAVNPVAQSGNLITRTTATYYSQINNTLLDNQAQAKFNWGPTQHTVLLGLDWLRMTDREVRYRGAAPVFNINAPDYTTPIAAPTTLFGNLDETLTQTGLYAQDQIKYQRFILTAGARYDRAKDTTRNYLTNTRVVADDGAVSGRVGLTYMVTPELAPYVSYSTSFLPQSGSDFFGTPFEPSKAKQYEVGIKYQPADQKSLFTAAVFDLTKTNVLTSDPLHTNFSVPTGEVRSRGVELEAKGEIARGLNITAAYTYTQVENTKNTTANLQGKTPILVPRHAASLWMDYTVQAGALAGLGLGGGARYTGRNYANAVNTVQNASVTVFDAVLHFTSGRWRYALNVNNLTNKEYTSCLAEPNLTCFWAPERTAILSARYKW
ncbi:TonB-dependent siderophore receptor [Herbaspirillum sp. LeCh32-8]|uniref:TonB-dependent siderophore receptor n=1 Tax=Herbaspirillum sp. LeCh32-8 TaxID=2821356 RepID=UPI001AE7D273|nr:TonB-dependent siderophore receptor [Herbaspirillum sp. LeCh32-8]MBP0599796.1 TonB-dependent siderophore receptor [Herbaspirillum sp. LeCh32-8]